MNRQDVWWLSLVKTLDQMAVSAGLASGDVWSATGVSAERHADWVRGRVEPTSAEMWRFAHAVGARLVVGVDGRRLRTTSEQKTAESEAERSVLEHAAVTSWLQRSIGFNPMWEGMSALPKRAAKAGRRVDIRVENEWGSVVGEWTMGSPVVPARSMPTPPRKRASAGSGVSRVNAS